MGTIQGSINQMIGTIAGGIKDYKKQQAIQDISEQPQQQQNSPILPMDIAMQSFRMRAHHQIQQRDAFNQFKDNLGQYRKPTLGELTFQNKIKAGEKDG